VAIAAAAVAEVVAEGEVEEAADLAVADEEAVETPTTPIMIIVMSVSLTRLIVLITNSLGMAPVLEVIPLSRA
jgi:hypothetical protein